MPPSALVQLIYLTLLQPIPKVSKASLPLELAYTFEQSMCMFSPGILASAAGKFADLSQYLHLHALKTAGW